MKRIIAATMVIALIGAACVKNSGTTDLNPDCLANEKLFTGSGLAGKWKFTGYYMSTGAPGKWYPANPQTVLQLNTDGTVCGDYFSEKIVKYQSREEKTGDRIDHILTFTKDDGSTFGQRYYLKDNELQLSPYPQMCIEGCANKFGRLK